MGSKNKGAGMLLLKITITGILFVLTTLFFISLIIKEN